MITSLTSGLPIRDTCTQPPETSRPPLFKVTEPARLAVVQTPIVALGSSAGTGQPVVFPGPLSSEMGTCSAIVCTLKLRR